MIGFYIGFIVNGIYCIYTDRKTEENFKKTELIYKQIKLKHNIDFQNFKKQIENLEEKKNEWVTKQSRILKYFHYNFYFCLFFLFHHQLD